MTRQPALPAATPRTTTQLLLARGGDPFAQARASVESAHRSVTELLAFLPPDQRGLARRFRNVQTMLVHALEHLPGASPVPLAAIRTLAVAAGWGEAVVVSGAPNGRDPVNPDAQAEPVYGFRGALEGTRRYLQQATEGLGQAPARWGAQHLARAGAVAHAASAVDHLAAVFAAAMWDFERPGMPPLPSKVGRIELRASPRSAPQTTWARYARAMFLSDRVELTTAQGRRVIGTDAPIAFLMHVVPPSPTSAVLAYDPAERWAPVPLHDELGVVHLCDAEGRSMGAIAVADWLAQPQLTVAQGAQAHTGERLRAYDRLVHPIEASGISAGAATLRVPIRRGVVHPPHVDPDRLTPPPRRRVGGAGADATPPAALAPPVAAEVIRPAPHLLPYSGMAASPGRALLRRQRRHKARQLDPGPSSPATELLRILYPTALWVGGLGTGYLLAEQWWVRLAVLVAVAAVVEPWLTWVVRRVADLDRRRMRAVYRPGVGPDQTRRFHRHAALLFDGANIGARTGTHHEVWIAAPSDADLGVIELRRLLHDGDAWGYALVDRRGTWRLVLPADLWAPDGDLTGLAGFAQAAGLTVGDETAPPPAEITDDVTLESSPSVVRRSRGPLTRGMVLMSVHSGAAFLVTLPGSDAATTLLLGITAVALVPVGLRAAWTRWSAGRP